MMHYTLTRHVTHYLTHDTLTGYTYPRLYTRGFEREVARQGGLCPVGTDCLTRPVVDDVDAELLELLLP